MQIVPLGIGHQNPWRVRSWDSFAIPRPFSRVRCLFGQPISVPSNLQPNKLDPHLNHLQIELDSLSIAAESWANTGILNEPPVIIQSHLDVPAIQQPQRTSQVQAGVGSERGD
jgi:hypothetical protein